VVFFSPTPLAKPTPKRPVSTPVIILIAVVAAAAIVSILVFATFYPVNFNRANPDNQTNVQKLSFNPQKGEGQANILDQDLQGKTGFIAVSAATTQFANRQKSPF